MLYPIQDFYEVTSIGLCTESRYVFCNLVLAVIGEMQF